MTFLKSEIKRFKQFEPNSDLEVLSRGLKRVYQTTVNYEEYVINALDHPYSNGKIEGLNNQIKTLKKVAYGFRNFDNFRTRIMLKKNIKTKSTLPKRHQLELEAFI